MAVVMPAEQRKVVCRVTPTQAHTWALCGGYFQAQYRSGRSYVATHSGLLGTAVHELAAAFDRSACGSPRAIDDVVGRNWRAGRFAAADDRPALAEARTLLAAYATQRQTEAVQVKVLDSEVFCQTPPRAVGAGYAIVLSGRIDRVARRSDGTIEILDLKTGAYLPTYDELYHDPATTIYHLLAAERYHTEQIVVAQLSLRTGARIEVSLDADGLAAGKNLLREMARQIAADDFALTPSASCAFCPARDTCPALQATDATIDRPL